MIDLGQALINAARGGQLEAVRTLLGQGADVDALNTRRFISQPTVDTWMWRSCSLTAGSRSTVWPVGT